MMNEDRILGQAKRVHEVLVRAVKVGKTGQIRFIKLVQAETDPLSHPLHQT